MIDVGTVTCNEVATPRFQMSHIECKEALIFGN